MKVTTIGLDLAKSVFQLHGADKAGRVVFRKRLKRSEVLEFFSLMAPCVVAMEACSGSHHWGRKLRALGHDVRLIAPQYVKPYVKGQKNDVTDAAAICEAATRPHMRFVALKHVDQQSVLALHTARSGFVKQRTALSNQIRGLLAEFGVVLPQGLNKLKQQLPLILSQVQNELTDAVRDLLRQLENQLKSLTALILVLEGQIRCWANHHEDSRRLQQIPGIGALTASALAASAGNARQFNCGRQLAAWIGLVPRQHSSGGKSVLLGITKRGDKYLRTLLIHGARSLLLAYQRNPAKQPPAIAQLLQRKHPNVVCVALANRNARIAWAMLTRGEDYQNSYATIPNTLE